MPATFTCWTTWFCSTISTIWYIGRTNRTFTYWITTTWSRYSFSFTRGTWCISTCTSVAIRFTRTSTWWRVNFNNYCFTFGCCTFLIRTSSFDCFFTSTIKWNSSGFVIVISSNCCTTYCKFCYWNNRRGASYCKCYSFFITVITTFLFCCCWNINCWWNS